MDYLDERPSNSILFKFLQRLNINSIIKNTILKYYTLNLKRLCNKSYDLIFFVNIESIDQSILDLIASTFPQSKRVLYMWDSSRNKKNYIQLIDSFHKCFSFDIQDCDMNENLYYEPLFYSKHNDIAIKDKNIDISFIGTIHQDRMKIVLELEKQAVKSGLNMYTYFYYPNKYLFLLRCLFDKNIYFRDYSKVNFSPLNYECFHDVITRSKYVVDINHPSQTGLTMRTIEVIGCGSKVISTNVFAKKTKLYKDKTITIIDRENPILPSNYDRPINCGYNQYYITNWITRILNKSEVL